jgi:predicted RNA-binding protein YlxR (DUF448 family)
MSSNDTFNNVERKRAERREYFARRRAGTPIRRCVFCWRRLSDEVEAEKLLWHFGVRQQAVTAARTANRSFLVHKQCLESWERAAKLIAAGKLYQALPEELAQYKLKLGQTDLKLYTFVVKFFTLLRQMQFVDLLKCPEYLRFMGSGS